MNRGPRPLTLLTVLLAATAWPVLATSAEAPATQPAQDEARDGEGDKNDEVKPLEDERTKRFMEFGELPNRMKNDGAPKIGEVAPPLKLNMLEGKKEVDLDRKSVV